MAVLETMTETISRDSRIISHNVRKKIQKIGRFSEKFCSLEIRVEMQIAVLTNLLEICGQNCKKISLESENQLKNLDFNEMILINQNNPLYRKKAVSRTLETIF